MLPLKGSLGWGFVAGLQGVALTMDYSSLELRRNNFSFLIFHFQGLVIQALESCPRS